MWWQGHSNEVILDRQQNFSIDTIIHPLWLDVKSVRTCFITPLHKCFGKWAVKNKSKNTCWYTENQHLACQQYDELWIHLSLHMYFQCKLTCPKKPHPQNTWKTTLLCINYYTNISIWMSFLGTVFYFLGRAAMWNLVWNVMKIHYQW